MRKEEFFARTMHTPDDPARAELRAALRELWKHLMPLHRALIDSARDEFTATVGPVSGPSQMLQLLNDDPFFAWLKPVTKLIVDIDEMSRTDFDRAGVDGIVGRVDGLFGASADPEFSARYVPILQRDVDTAIAHAGIRKALVRLRRP